MSAERLWFIISVFLYVGGMFFSYLMYLNPVWDYYGFKYVEPELHEVCIVLVLIFFTSLFLPSRMRNPGSVIVLLLHCVVYVPGLVICLLVTKNGVFKYGYILLALTLAFIVISLAARHASAHGSIIKVETSRLGRGAVLAGWVTLAATLIYEYHSSMSFVGLENVYDQRAETSTLGGVISYVKTYFAYVLTPILFALGLNEKRPLYLIIGFCGFILMYMVSAERTIFLMPFLILVFNWLLRKETGFGRSASVIYLGLAAFVVFTSLFYAVNEIAALFGIYFLFRTLALPGLSISLYEDLFGRYGYTHWTHVKGVGSLVDGPKFFVSDDAWPQLGVLVGKYMYNAPGNNYNANLFSGDGVAAAGAVGILCISIPLSIWIYFLNKLSSAWDSRFSILIILPLGIILTNGHFFTMLLSFGGLFALLFFSFFSSKKN